MSNQPDIRLDMMAGVASSRQVARGPLLESQGLAEIPTRSKKLGESESERDGIAAFGHSRANGIILHYTICKIGIRRPRPTIGGERVNWIDDGRPQEEQRPRLSGAQEFQVTKGDMLHVPARSWHQVLTEDGESITYALINVFE